MTRPLSLALVLLWTSTAHANPEITVDLPGGATMDFVWIEPGTFMMGEAEHGETPHQVTLTRGYWLGKYEVTLGQWRPSMGNPLPSGGHLLLGDANAPAVYISWNQVQVYIHALNQAAGDSLYRLPTEAEWEYACRAGTTTRWSFGDDETELGLYAWYRDNSYDAEYQEAAPQIVGTKLPNPWGLYDMHGNAREWVQDLAGRYSEAPQVDPTSPAMVDSEGDERVFRSAGVYDRAGATESSFRANFGVDGRLTDAGTRLVRRGSAPTGTPTPVTPRGWGRIKSGGRTTR